MADSVDMFGDAVVYALSLYALHRGARWEAGAALAKGGLILAFGVAVLFEIADKIANGVPPASGLMLGVGSAALVANLNIGRAPCRERVCQYLSISVVAGS